MCRSPFNDVRKRSSFLCSSVGVGCGEDPNASYDVNGHDPDPQPRYDYSNENSCGQCPVIVMGLATPHVMVDECRLSVVVSRHPLPLHDLPDCKRT
nr:furin-like [Biomphalaria glabrata]